VEWQEVGQLVGTALASYVASVATMRQRIDHDVDSRMKQPRERLDVFSNQIDGLVKACDALSQRCKALEDRAVKFVTDEEFHAYVRTTTDAVNGLSEKVGRAAGAIEAWYNGNRK